MQLYFQLYLLLHKVAVGKQLHIHKATFIPTINAWYSLYWRVLLPNGATFTSLHCILCCKGSVGYAKNAGLGTWKIVLIQELVKTLFHQRKVVGCNLNILQEPANSIETLSRGAAVWGTGLLGVRQTILFWFLKDNFPPPLKHFLDFLHADFSKKKFPKFWNIPWERIPISGQL